ncbi:unnamed protein product [[Candida] boidinii]|nr:unnamed protein product [[Candida] boidinii]
MAGLGISSSSNPAQDTDNKSLPSIPTSAKARAQPLPLLPGEKKEYDDRTLPPTPSNNDNKHNDKMKSTKHPNGSAPTLPVKDNGLEYDDVNYLPIIATQSATASPSLASTESGPIGQMQLHHPNATPINSRKRILIPWSTISWESIF